MAVKALQLGAEHGIVDTGQERLIGRQGRRLGYVVGGKLVRGVVQVNLVKHAVGIVAGQERPVLYPVSLPLTGEPLQIGLGRQLVGAQAWRLLPEHAAALQFGVAQHPAQYDASIVYVVYHGEDAGRLQVGTSLDGLRVYAPLGSPLGKGMAQILGSGVADIAPELIIIPIGTHGILVAAYGNDVDTLAGGQADRPVIVGHTGNDVVMGYDPAAGHMAVLYPQVAVVLINLDFHLRVL